VSLVRRLVRLRLDEISAVEHGSRIEYYDDGTVKAAGRMKDGRLHGDWRWYRRDGSLSRTGRFRCGARVGTWETWDRDGHLVRTTELGS
jgi:antitoxin component YwqK of YwqJK toxin-antitoxin module